MSWVMWCFMVLLVLYLTPYFLDSQFTYHPVKVRVDNPARGVYRDLFYQSTNRFATSCAMTTINHILHTLGIPLRKEVTTSITVKSAHRQLQQLLPDHHVDLLIGPNLSELRQVLTFANEPDHFIIANYSRIPVWFADYSMLKMVAYEISHMQLYTFSGHYSPILAFDAANDEVLIHDVNINPRFYDHTLDVITFQQAMYKPSHLTGLRRGLIHVYPKRKIQS